LEQPRKVGILRRFAEAGADDLFGESSHQMDGAVAEVGEFFGMAERPGSVGGDCRVVAGVCVR
jgi:hypothetical protein